MKTIRNTSLSALALLLALNVSIKASYSDEEDSPKGHYSIGKDDDWEIKSDLSRAFSDRKGPASKKPSKDEELSYGPEDEWEVGSQYTARSEGRTKESQKLSDIKDLRRHMNKGNIEITPSTHEALLKYSEFYATSFHAFDKGVVIKGWKTSLGFDPLLDILQSFSNLKTFKLGIEWDKEEDVTELLTRTLQFYESLTDLDISGCHLNDKGMAEIMEAIQNPASLKNLDVSDNKLTPKGIQALKAHFVNLASLKGDISLEESKSLNTLSLESLNLTSTTKAQPATVSSVPTTILPQKKPLMAAYVPTPPVSPDEQGLPSDLLMKAKAGDPAAQTEIAVLYEKGETVGQNSIKAYEWFTKAATQGNEDAKQALKRLGVQGISAPARRLSDEQSLPRELLRKAKANEAVAQKRIGDMYYSGWGVPQNHNKAIEWYQKAAVQGYAAAQDALGWTYLSGQGVASDYHKAIEWYKKAANQAHPSAQHMLATMYENGQGVSQDDLQAIEWHQRAADHGIAGSLFSLKKIYERKASNNDREALYNLGWMHENGRGVDPNKTIAIEWYTKAATQGNEDAKQALKRLEVQY